MLLDIQIVSLLLEEGSDPNLQSSMRQTALFLLLKHGYLEKDVEFLEGFIYLSQSSIPVDGSFYNFYLTRKVNILSGYMIRILKGEIRLNNTKSTRH